MRALHRMQVLEENARKTSQQYLAYGTYCSKHSTTYSAKIFFTALSVPVYLMKQILTHANGEVETEHTSNRCSQFY